MRLVFLVLACFLSACSRMPTPNFQALTLPLTANYYLMCPQDYCNVTPGAYSPVYPVSADELFGVFNQMVSTEPTVNFTYTIPENGQYGLVAHSWLFGLPDDVSVQFIALSDHTSTLVIYSKSRYSPYDFGANKRRTDRWALKLAQIISK